MGRRNWAPSRSAVRISFAQPISSKRSSALVGIGGQSNPGWKAHTTAVWPVQKFTWRDLTAKRGETYTYRIVPMTGAPGHLIPQEGDALTTDPVTITEKRGDFSAYFNRGILS